MFNEREQPNTRVGNVSSTIKRVLLSNWRLEKVNRFFPPLPRVSSRFPGQLP